MRLQMLKTIAKYNLTMDLLLSLETRKWGGGEFRDVGTFIISPFSPSRYLTVIYRSQTGSERGYYS